MTGFELRTYGVWSDRSTNWATTTAFKTFFEPLIDNVLLYLSGIKNTKWELYMHFGGTALLVNAIAISHSNKFKILWKLLFLEHALKLETINNTTATYLLTMRCLWLFSRIYTDEVNTQSLGKNKAVYKLKADKLSLNSVNAKCKYLEALMKTTIQTDTYHNVISPSTTVWPEKIAKCL